MGIISMFINFLGRARLLVHVWFAISAAALTLAFLLPRDFRDLLPGIALVVYLGILSEVVIYSRTLISTILSGMVAASVVLGLLASLEKAGFWFPGPGWFTLLCGVYAAAVLSYNDASWIDTGR